MVPLLSIGLSATRGVRFPVVITHGVSLFPCAFLSEKSRNLDGDQGLIGEASIDLSPLAEGRPVLAEWTTIEDAAGRRAGQVSVSARWAKPLRTGGDPGPHGLSAEEVDGLMARFSPNKDGQASRSGEMQLSVTLEASSVVVTPEYRVHTVLYFCGAHLQWLVRIVYRVLLVAR